MIKILGKLPKTVHLAISGGVDSMVSYDFLSKNHNVVPLFFHHGTENSENAYKFLQSIFKNKLIAGKITREKQSDESLEEYWRKERYKFLEEYKENYLITAHHLDDNVENWIFSSLHGKPKLIQWYNNLCYRPFLLNRKEEFYKWAEYHKVCYIEDQSNNDLSKKRNYIRKELIPKVLNVNPGIYKVIYKKTMNNYFSQVEDKL